MALEGQYLKDLILHKAQIGLGQIDTGLIRETIKVNGRVMENHLHDVIHHIIGHYVLVPDNVNHLNIMANNTLTGVSSMVHLEILGQNAKKGRMKVNQARTRRTNIIHKNRLVEVDHLHDVIPNIMGHLKIW